MHAVSALTLVSVQNTADFRQVLPLEPELVRDQIDALLEDVRIVAVKTGMLATPEVAEVVARVVGTGVLGDAVVIVEHLLRVVNQLATRVVVLDRGTVLADGEPQTVMRDPEVVRAYLGKHAHA